MTWSKDSFSLVLNLDQSPFLEVLQRKMLFLQIESNKEGKMMKKKRTIFLVLALTVVMVSCEKSKTKPLREREYSIFKMFSNKAFRDDYPIFVKAKELTGVTLIGSVSEGATDERQSFILMQRKELPDIVSFTDASKLDLLGIEGKLIPLEDLIREHAPHIQSYLDSNPKALYGAQTPSGHIYQIPFYQPPELQISQGLYIRQDWLDKLNLATPTTIEELETVFIAFKEQDPNGNGIADEIPFFKRSASPASVFEVLVDLFNASSSFDIDEQDEVVFGPAQESYKTALKTMQRWYMMGLIDPEIFTRGPKTRDYMLNNNLGGATIDWFGSTGNYNAKLASKIEGFNFKAILPPSVNGKVRTVLSRKSFRGGWGISAVAEDPQGIMEYFDFWFTPEGRRLWNYGIENEDWTMDDKGVPRFTAKVLNDPERGALQVLREQGHIDFIGVVVDPNYEFGWMSDVGTAGMKLYFENNIIQPFPQLKFSKEQMKTYDELDEPWLQTSVRTQSQQWVLNSTDIDAAWNSYLQGLMDINLEKILEIKRQEYEKFKNT